MGRGPGKRLDVGGVPRMQLMLLHRIENLSVSVKMRLIVWQNARIWGPKRGQGAQPDKLT